MRLVIDTNVWISGLLVRGGPPARVAQVTALKHQPVFSTATFDELRTRVWRAKFDRHLSVEVRNGFLRRIEGKVAYWVDISPEIAAQRYCRDVDDDKFIHAALAHTRHGLSLATATCSTFRLSQASASSPPPRRSPFPTSWERMTDPAPTLS